MPAPVVFTGGMVTDAGVGLGVGTAGALAPAAGEVAAPSASTGSGMRSAELLGAAADSTGSAGQTSGDSATAASGIAAAVAAAAGVAAGAATAPTGAGDAGRGASDTGAGSAGAGAVGATVELSSGSEGSAVVSTSEPSFSAPSVLESRIFLPLLLLLRPVDKRKRCKAGLISSGIAMLIGHPIAVRPSAMPAEGQRPHRDARAALCGKTRRK